ncbi:MAG: DUF3006 domain-containing protein [Clostridiaceae bacterium]|nr:DUF3006 domain-containing protein [Clostridiaceae bacterium]
MMKVILDRFEGEFAVCEVAGERRMIQILKSSCPAAAKEGDVLLIDQETVSIDTAETQARKERITDLMKSLWD